MSIRISFHDGYWYVDVLRSPAGSFKAYSRHTTIDDALEQARLVALNNEIEL